jgi:hypothetical protein
MSNTVLLVHRFLILIINIDFLQLSSTVGHGGLGRIWRTPPPRFHFFLPSFYLFLESQPLLCLLVGVVHYMAARIRQNVYGRG